MLRDDFCGAFSLSLIYIYISKFPLQHKFIEKCNTGASKMLAKIKDAKKIRATLAAQNQLSDPDDVCLTPFHHQLYLHSIYYYGIHSVLKN